MLEWINEPEALLKTSMDTPQKVDFSVLTLFYEKVISELEDLEASLLGKEPRSTLTSSNQN